MALRVFVSPSSSSRSRSMDVLVRGSRAPPALRDRAEETACRLTLQALFRCQQGTSNRLRALARAVEEELRVWLSSLPSSLRDDLLRCCLKRLSATLLGQPEANAVASLPVLAASCTEVLYDPNFSRLSVSEHLQWHRESRMRVLHLLHSSGASSMRSLSFPCYAGRAFRFEQPPFSERYLVTSCFRHLRRLRRLLLPGVCDDELLAFVGASCPVLEDLDVKDSFALSDQGIRWFVRADELPAHPISFQGQSGPQNLKSRVGFLPTPLIQTPRRGTDHHVRTRSRCSREDNDVSPPPPLTSANFEGCSGLTRSGGEALLHGCGRSLQSLRLDASLWDSMLAAVLAEGDLAAGGDACPDCMSAPALRTADNLTVADAEQAMGVLHLFPGLERLVLTGVKASQWSSVEEEEKEGGTEEDYLVTLGEVLSCFEDAVEITLAETKLADVAAHLRHDSFGRRLGTLCVTGRSSVVDCLLLAQCCPDLSSLSVSHAVLKVISRQERRTDLLPKLRSLRLWEVKSEEGQPDDAWRELVKRLPSLRSLYLWNVVVTDSDVSEVFSQNPLLHLEELRISSSEIGFLRLTEVAAELVVRRCPRLHTIGGVCDWGIRDLLTLLHDLLMLETPIKVSRDCLSQMNPMQVHAKCLDAPGSSNTTATTDDGGKGTKIKVRRKRNVLVTPLDVAGRGCYGTVFRCLVKGSKERTGRVQAMKVTPASKSSSWRELRILKRIGRESPNVSGLNLFFKSDVGGERKLHLLFDYLPNGTLFGELHVKDEGLGDGTSTLLTVSLLRGLDYLHRKAKVCHRDIKPSNLLLVREGGGDAGRLTSLKICDFGSAVFLREGGDPSPTSPYVCSRFYRPPELLLGCLRHLGEAVDLWAAGCVAAEMWTGRVLFQGEDSQMEQLAEIADLIGSPRRDKEGEGDDNSTTTRSELEELGVNRKLTDILFDSFSSSSSSLSRLSLSERLCSELGLPKEEEEEEARQHPLLTVVKGTLVYSPKRRKPAEKLLAILQNKL